MRPHGGLESAMTVSRQADMEIGGLVRQFLRLGPKRAQCRLLANLDFLISVTGWSAKGDRVT